MNSIPAKVIELLGRTGVKGIIQVRCKTLDDKEKVLTRNVIGPIRIGDVLILKEIEMESAEKLNKRR